MDTRLDRLAGEMIRYYRGDAKRIQHFIKVHAFARLIGREEGLLADAMEILEAAALVHDIGIRISEEKYGSSAGKYQELEGPPEAEKMLARLGFSETVIRRVSWLVGHHHTYDAIEGEDYRILVEADFLVNLFESGSGADAARAAYDSIFRTKTGREICREMFALPDVK